MSWGERLHRIFQLRQTGKVDPTPMTAHELGFDEIERAFAMMQNKEDGIIKPLLHPRRDAGGSKSRE